MRKYVGKILSVIAVAAVLVYVLWWGGNAPGLRGWQTSKLESAVIPEQNASSTISETVTAPEIKNEHEKKEPLSTESVQAESVASEREEPKAALGKNEAISVPPVAATEKTKPQCTLSVRCDTILDNLSWLDEAKIALVPSDGVVYAEKTVEFTPGETVFDVLLRELTSCDIHMEFENTPIYNSVYIEGIGNLYEFDCGELSGWMYRVNGVFPNYGCSRYELKNGDKIEWVYTCDLGTDVGGSYSAQNGK